MAIKQTWRGFVSLNILISGIISCFTGIVLYFVPQGRVARWILWDFLGMGKDAWGAIHILSSYLFLIFFILHTINNWKPIVNYVVKKAGGLNQVPQILAAILISLVIFVSGAFSLYPLQYVIDFGEYLKTLAVSSPDDEPPFGHAEEVTLPSFCRKMDINVQKAMDLLKEKGIEIESKEQTLAEIASSNNITPLDLYLLIKPLEEMPVVAKKAESKEGFTDKDLDEIFSQPGQGRKSIADIAKQLNISVDVALERLAAKGLTAKADDKLKDLKGVLPELATATDVIRVIAAVKDEK